MIWATVSSTLRRAARFCAFNTVPRDPFNVITKPPPPSKGRTLTFANMADSDTQMVETVDVPAMREKTVLVASETVPPPKLANPKMVTLV